MDRSLVGLGDRERNFVRRRTYRAYAEISISQLDLRPGCYAWITTPTSAEKATRLLFEWDSGEKVLTVNGAQIYPGRAAPSEARSEEELEAIFGKFPVVRQFRSELGTWAAASNKFIVMGINFEDEIRSKCRLLDSGELTKDDIRGFVDDALSRAPLSEAFSHERGIEFHDQTFVIYSLYPGRDPIEQELSYFEVGKQAEEIPQKEHADGIVREVVGFYNLEPFLPHIAFISNRGVDATAFGYQTVSKIENDIDMALHDRSASSGGSGARVPRHAIRSIAKNFGGEK